MDTAAQAKPATIAELLTEHSAQPILMDIGSAGTSPEIWRSLASASTIIGFEPDSRNPDKTFGKGFARAMMIDRVVVPDETLEEAQFILTQYPSCSSLLEADLDALSSFSFRDYFRPVGTAKFPATSLNRALRQLDVSGVNWLKIDSQGLDLQLLRSIAPEFLERLFVVDIEPGFIDAYKGEDLFPACHAWLKDQGFWLSELKCQAYPKVRPETLDALEARGFDRKRVLAKLTKSPTAAEGRYFREIRWIARNVPDARDWMIIFTFALACRLTGYALDLVAAYTERFGEDATSNRLTMLAEDALRKAIA